MDLENAIQLNGYSGFRVLLYKNRDGVDIIRKQAAERSQNERVKKQYEKHLFFQDLNSQLYSVPEVLGARESSDGLFYYEYKFVEGTSLIHFINNSSMENIRLVCDNILNILSEFRSQNSYFEPIEPEARFFYSLYQKITNNLRLCRLETETENKLLKGLQKFREHGEKTACHGDFSLDNIIVDKNKNLWLIDFLDLFYPHYFFDISKMFQCIDGGWCELKYGIALPPNKLVFIRNYLLEKIHAADSSYREHHDFLLAFVFLRILPYAKSENDRKIIEEKIKYFINLA